MVTGSKKERRTRRHTRIRAKVAGTSTCPRLSVFRSNTRIVAQIIDDEAKKTLVAVSTADSKKKTMQERIVESAAVLADGAKKKKVTAVVFDRGGFIYTGNIKLFADSVRKSGITF
jgi:large subunit ribosomal protein L18